MPREERITGFEGHEFGSADTLDKSLLSLILANREEIGKLHDRITELAWKLSVEIANNNAPKETPEGSSDWRPEA